MSQQDWHLISSYAGILTLATFSVYAGSFGSLKVSGLSIFNVLLFIKKNLHVKKLNRHLEVLKEKKTPVMMTVNKKTRKFLRG